MPSRKRKRKVDYDYSLALKTREVIGSAVNNAVRWGGLVGIFYFLYMMTNSLSGKNTLASVGFGFLADVRTSRGVAMFLMAAFGVSGSIYGLRERKLRRDDIERRAKHIKLLEIDADKRRSSSGLSPRGTTRKEDLQ